MGLCKCPERKITNLFCYEHRVNVCEHCLMHNHSSCVVDTYRNWITDSVYSNKCTLCDHDLRSTSNELANSETIRLLCFHIVHWDCLDAYARSLPPTTAPAGYTCPVCKKMCLFPALNQVSPIADVLRRKMREVNWARSGLGLPLLEEEVVPAKKIHVNGFQNDSMLRPNYHDNDMDKLSDVSENSIPNNNVPSNFHRYSSPTDNHPQQHEDTFSKLHQSYGSSSPGHYYSDVSTGSPLQTNPRKSIKSEYETPLLIDEDDHKYRRRSPFESLTRWLKNMSPVAKRRANRRRALYAVLSIIVIVIVLMIIFGRRDEDDGFNPKANPNVLIGEGPAIHLELE